MNEGMNEGMITEMSCSFLNISAPAAKRTDEYNLVSVQINDEQ